MTAPALRAQVTGNPIFETITAPQTGPTTVATSGSGVSYDFDARLFETTTGAVSSAALTYPGGTVAYSAPTPGNPTTFNYDPGTFATLAALNTAFQFGTYTTQYSGGTAGTGTRTTNFTQQAFSLSTPTFSAGTYSGFQSLNAAQSFTASFNPYVTGNVANESDIFFDIYNVATGANVLDYGFQPSSLTSFSVPANTLLPSTAYYAQLDFSNRINSLDTNGLPNHLDDLGFDRKTILNFTTAPTPVPEASTTVSLGLLLALGVIPEMGGMIVAARRRKA